MINSPNMTAAQLISALQRLSPDAEVLINIKGDKVYGLMQLPVKSTIEKDGYEFWVDATYRGATITVHLPKKAFITQRKTMP